MAPWSETQIPDQSGRIAIVTGASSGIGAEAASVLAAKGATVILAVRDHARGDAACAQILGRHPGAKVSVSLLDLASLASIRDFAGRMLATLPQIDVLLNNAGLGMRPVRAVTMDGFERQFGTNHLGHFALTGLLVPALLRAPGPRVVSIASLVHRRGRMNFPDLQSERDYKGGRAYSQSKLANLLFTLELDRRARAAGSKLAGVAAHPGLSSTGFVSAIGLPSYQEKIGTVVIGLIGQDSVRGAWPGLYAATMPGVRGGDYWGPDGFLEIRGNPAPAKLFPQARDPRAATQLWNVSEELTGVTYPPLA